MATREVMLHITVHHAEPTALGLFAREVAPAATAMAPGSAAPALSSYFVDTPRVTNGPPTAARAPQAYPAGARGGLVRSR